GETFVSFTQSPGGQPATLVGGSTSTATWTTLATGSTATFILVAHTSASLVNNSTLTNTASVSASNDTNGLNNAATVSTSVSAPSADMAVTQTGPPPLVAGKHITSPTPPTHNRPRAPPTP